MQKFSRQTSTFCLFLVGLTGAAPSQAASTETPVKPDSSRVAAIAAMLPPSPAGLGQPITDAEAWRPMRMASDAAGIIEAAEKLTETPIPDLTDEVFLDFSRTGSRTRCQRVLSLRHPRIARFTLAECLEDQGRFLPALEESIRAVCSEKTWVMPAHDRDLKNFRGEEISIDLAVAGRSWELATAYYWLGDRLRPEIRQLIRDQLRQRTFDPFRRYVNTGAPRMSWVAY